MHLYTRIALLVAIASVAKCSVILDGISPEHEVHREGKGISQEHEVHREGKGMSQEHETHREGKRIKGQRTILPILDLLLSGIPFDSSNCTAGACLSQKECLNQNGTVGDRCARGFGVCCVTMGDYVGGDTVITGDGGPFLSPPAAAFRQEADDNTFTATLVPGPDVVQIKLDIVSLVLLGPTEGECTNDTLVVRGYNPGLEIPTLCGSISNQQLYIDIDNSGGPHTVTVVRSTFPGTRSWEIYVSFLKEADAVQRRCLQYHTATEGTIKSFNFGGDPPMALVDQTYSICFGYVVGFCDVAFSFSRLDLGNVNGVCDGEYLLIGDDKVCGDVDDYSAKVNATGPIIVNVRTSSMNDLEKEGFSASYTMMGC